MNIKNSWQKALSHTEILRSRVQALLTFNETFVPYVFLSESQINPGDTVVRTGELLFEKPSLILPSNHPQFEGFDFETQDMDSPFFMNFLFIRGVSLPSFKYNNKTRSLEIFEGPLKDAVKLHLNRLQSQEDIQTGLLTGPEDCWQFSLMILICSLITKNAEQDIHRLLKEYKKQDLN